VNKETFNYNDNEQFINATCNPFEIIQWVDQMFSGKLYLLIYAV